ncbi:MAG: carboxypeptidase-like regulatory domain-containing protein [Melioribacteraceae bacterium]|nr:MAG: carboxypeptidase-like regulatory domain-containing protein [Melioribacteraceae bacterium]
MKNMICVIFLIVFITSCEEKIITTLPLEEGTISGYTIDSTNQRSLKSVEINLSYNNLSTSSDFNGFFQFEDIPVGNYNIIFESLGYKNKEIEVSLKDTLLNLNNILLIREKFPYDAITYDELPRLYQPDSTYYKLPEEYIDQYKHYWFGSYYDSVYVNNFIDSLIIEMKKMRIDVDTLWYQSFDFQCSDPAISAPSKICVKLKTKNDKMYSLNYKSFNPDRERYFLIWDYCQRRPLQYRIYYKFN